MICSEDLTVNGNLVGDNATNISGIASVTTTRLIVNSGGVNVTGIATFADELDAAQYEGNFILDSYLFT